MNLKSKLENNKSCSKEFESFSNTHLKRKILYEIARSKVISSDVRFIKYYNTIFKSRFVSRTEFINEMCADEEQWVR